MSKASELFEAGMSAVQLSFTADTQSDLRDDLDRARACFEGVLALDPLFPRAQHQRALVLSRLGLQEEAVDAFVAAAALAPDDVELHRATAQSLARLGRHEAAAGEFEAVLRHLPDDPEALFGRALALTELRRDAEALPAWDAVLTRADTRQLNVDGVQARVLTDDFRRAQALFWRAMTLTRLRHPEAVAAWRDIFATHLRALLSWSSSSPLHRALAEYEACRLALEAHAQARADDALTWRFVCELWRRAGRHADAVRAAERLVALAPKDSRAWFDKAETHVAAGQLPEALAAFEQSLRLEPGFLGAKARLEVVRKQASQR